MVAKKRSAIRHLAPPWTPEPWIILFLRALHTKATQPPPHYEKHIATILEEWSRKESMPALRASLGVAPSRTEGRRRTRQRANSEMAIVNAYIGAGARGEDDPKHAAARDCRVSVEKVTEVLAKHKAPMTDAAPNILGALFTLAERPGTKRRRGQPR